MRHGERTGTALALLWFAASAMGASPNTTTGGIESMEKAGFDAVAGMIDTLRQRPQGPDGGPQPPPIERSSDATTSLSSTGNPAGPAPGPEGAPSAPGFVPGAPAAIRSDGSRGIPTEAVTSLDGFSRSRVETGEAPEATLSRALQSGEEPGVVALPRHSPADEGAPVAETAPTAPTASGQAPVARGAVPESKTVGSAGTFKQPFATTLRLAIPAPPAREARTATPGVEAGVPSGRPAAGPGLAMPDARILSPLATPPGFSGGEVVAMPPTGAADRVVRGWTPAATAKLDRLGGSSEGAFIFPKNDDFKGAKVTEGTTRSAPAASSGVAPSRAVSAAAARPRGIETTFVAKLARLGRAIARRLSGTTTPAPAVAPGDVASRYREPRLLASILPGLFPGEVPEGNESETSVPRIVIPLSTGAGLALAMLVALSPFARWRRQRRRA